jgi:trk system potassium uptake protein TrkA
MYVLVVGGGKVGFHLARAVLDKGHEVTVLESRPARVQVLERALGEVVVFGDGTLPSVLEDAGCARADVLAAVTGDDAANLLVAVQASRRFRVRRTIARLNDPRNERLFRLAGIDATVSSSAILAELIEREVAAERVRTLLAFPGGGVGIVQVDLSERSPVSGCLVRDVPWPAGALLVTVLRAQGVVVPDGSTRLQAGDRLLLVASTASEEAVQNLLAPEPEAGA